MNLVRLAGKLQALALALGLEAVVVGSEEWRCAYPPGAEGLIDNEAVREGTGNFVVEFQGGEVLLVGCRTVPNESLLALFVEELLLGLAREESQRALLDAAAAINSNLKLRPLLDSIASMAERVLGAEASSVMLVDHAKDVLFWEVARGGKGGQLERMTLALGEGIGGAVARTGRPELIPNAQRDPRLARRFDDATTFVTRSMVCVPMKRGNQVLGVVQVLNKRHGTFDESDVELTQALASQAAIALENAQLYADLDTLFKEVVTALALTVEKRDRYTNGHSYRVMTHTVGLARAVGLSDAEVDEIELAAILHDIGKIGIPDAILNKPERLSRDEYEAMKLHPVIGAEILAPIKGMRRIARFVKEHHEKIDGTGYMEGLRGEQLALQSKIIAVSDVYDALTFEGRPYRAPLPPERALEIMNEPGHLDPALVDAFVRYLAGRAEEDAELADGQAGLEPGAAS